jgi:hypothetical protein
MSEEIAHPRLEYLSVEEAGGSAIVLVQAIHGLEWHA